MRLFSWQQRAEEALTGPALLNEFHFSVFAAFCSLSSSFREQPSESDATAFHI